MTATFANDIQFQSLCAGRARIDLVDFMLEFAQDAYPDLAPVKWRRQMDDLAARAPLNFPACLHGTVTERLQAVSDFLYVREGFEGDTDNYHDPRNSYLNEVLTRRRGLPITLGVVYMAIARRVGIPMFGVALPGHFMLGCDLDLSGRTITETVYVDPFHGGEIVTRQACWDRIESLLGQPGALSAAHFQPAKDHTIAVRMLRNLKAAHAMQSNWVAALPVQQRLVLLLPDQPLEERDLALIYLRNDQPYRAARLLEGYLAHCSADETTQLTPYLRTARKLLAELN